MRQGEAAPSGCGILEWKSQVGATEHHPGRDGFEKEGGFVAVELPFILMGIAQEDLTVGCVCPRFLSMEVTSTHHLGFPPQAAKCLGPALLKSISK